jgi:hypothetical protein
MTKYSWNRILRILSFKMHSTALNYNELLVKYLPDFLLFLIIITLLYINYLHQIYAKRRNRLNNIPEIYY